MESSTCTSTRERTIRACTDTIRYEYSVYAMSDIDTDTSTPCVGVTVTYIIMPGRSGERSYFTQCVAHSIQGSTCRPLATQTCVLSQFYDWLIRRNVSMIDSWDSCYHRLLVREGVRRHLLLVASTAPLGVGVTGTLVSGCSLSPATRAPPFQPYSSILDHMALPRAGQATSRAAGDRRECPLICCLMFNSSCWTCSDARNIYPPIQQSMQRTADIMSMLQVATRNNKQTKNSVYTNSII